MRNFNINLFNFFSSNFFFKITKMGKKKSTHQVLFDLK